MSQTSPKEVHALTVGEFDRLNSYMPEAAAELFALRGEVNALRRANASLVRWRGEIDSHLIAHRVEFPDDYDNSPKWAIGKLIECEVGRGFSEGMRWRDAAHDPPKDEQKVLACWHGPSCDPGMEALTYYAADAPDGPGGWRDAYAEYVDAPTHWMPLPEKPAP